MRSCLYLLAAAGMACASSTATGPASVRGNSYDYVATARDGTPLLAGTLTITLAPENVVTGSWDIHLLPWSGPIEVGPQVGSGNLVGWRSGDSLFLELNPDYRDNNVGLLAVPSGRGWRGEWQFVAINGPRSGGYFTATPQ